MMKSKKIYIYSFTALLILCGIIVLNTNKSKNNNSPINQIDNNNQYASYLIAQDCIYNNDFNTLSEQLSNLIKINNKTKSVISTINIGNFLSGNFNSEYFNKINIENSLPEFFIKLSYFIKTNQFNNVISELSTNNFKILNSFKLWSEIGNKNFSNAEKLIQQNNSENIKHLNLALLYNYQSNYKNALNQIKQISEEYLNINDFIYIYSFYKNNNITEDLKYPFKIINIEQKKPYTFDTIQKNLAFSIVNFISHNPDINDSILSLILLRSAEYLYPEYDPIYYYLSLYFFNIQNWTEFDKYINKITETSFLYEVAQLKYTDKYFLLNETNKGYDYLYKIIKQNPNFYPAITNIVFNYIQDNKINKAFDIISQTLSNKEISDETKGLLFKLRAHLNLLNYKFNLSEHDLLNALYYIPNDIGTINDLLYTWAKQNKNLNESEKLISSIIKKNPQNTAYWDTLAYISLQKNDLEFAKKIWNKISNANDATSVIFEHMGDLYIQLNNPNLAKIYYQKALDLKFDGFINTKKITAKLKNL